MPYMHPWTSRTGRPDRVRKLPGRSLFGGRSGKLFRRVRGRDVLSARRIELLAVLSGVALSHFRIERMHTVYRRLPFGARFALLPAVPWWQVYGVRWCGVVRYMHGGQLVEPQLCQLRTLHRRKMVCRKRTELHKLRTGSIFRAVGKLLRRLHTGVPCKSRGHAVLLGLRGWTVRRFVWDYRLRNVHTWPVRCWCCSSVRQL